MSTVKVIDHPMIQHKLSIMRNKNTSSKYFRELLDEIAMFMAYEVTRDLPLTDVQVETPITTMTAKMLQGPDIGIIPILRAGLGLVNGFLTLIPTAKVGHIGLYRDPDTLEPVEYYCKLPADAQKRELFVVDPMLATGGSASDAVSLIKEKGCSKIRLVCLIAAPEGIEAFTKRHPDVDVYVAAVDERLNEHGYIVPGLGDAGDRLYGTK